MLGQNRNLLNLQDSEENFWPTFTDLLSVIIFVILLVLVSYIFVAQVTTQQTQEARQLMKEMINNRIDEIVGFRETIVRELSNKFRSSDLTINFDENTGAISFSGEVLFETGSAVIRPEFKNMLEDFIPEYVGVILDERNKDNISQIIIEGHTDDTGSYMTNLDLSQRRAANVVKFILSEDFPGFEQKGELKYYLTANGKSESNLIYNDDGSINRERSRRVEIKFNLKDQYFIDKMKEIVNNT
ncbi:MAG: OmpA family protein [Halanaerobiales bacterium]